MFESGSPTTTNDQNSISTYSVSEIQDLLKKNNCLKGIFRLLLTAKDPSRYNIPFLRYRIFVKKAIDEKTTPLAQLAVNYQKSISIIRQKKTQCPDRLKATALPLTTTKIPSRYNLFLRYSISVKNTIGNRRCQDRLRVTSLQLPTIKDYLDIISVKNVIRRSIVPCADTRTLPEIRIFSKRNREDDEMRPARL